MSDDTNKKTPAAPGSSRKRRRRRGSRRRSGGGESGGGGGQGGSGQGGDAQKSSGNRAPDGNRQSGNKEGAAPGSSERKRKRRRRPRRGGRSGGGGGQGGGGGGGGNRGSSNRGGDNRGGDNRGGDNRGGDNRGGDNRGGDNRGRDNRADQQSRSSRSRDRRRAPLVAESRPEAIPETPVWEDTGPAPEMTPESLARWETPLFEADPDREDVLPAPAADDVTDLDGQPPRGEVTNIAHVRVKISTRLQDYDAGEFSLERGDQVVVQGDRGQAIGTVVAPSVRMLVTDRSSRRVLRRSTEHDLIQLERNEAKGQEVLPYARERIMDRRLPMKLTRVEYLHGGSKAVFYFSAEGRVDFRDLVKDLAQRLRTRIEMRQIGVRDEAKMVGGIGVCGLRLCCHRYLTKFEPVSIRMAKDQNLVLNPQKVSGQCGRLKCCLAYEQEIYREQRKGMPKLGKFVQTPEGVGKVVELDILARKVRVGLGMGKSEVFDAEDVEPAPPPPRPSGAR